MAMAIRRGIGWLLAVATAVYVGFCSFAIAYEKRSPARALAVGMPHSGTAEASLAYNAFSARRAGDPNAVVNPDEVRLAKSAYRQEPLSIPALGLIADSMPNGKEGTERQALFELAGKLNRRNTLVNTELVKAAALRGDDRAFFAWLSRVMLVGKEAKTTYGAAMAEATARNGAVEALIPIIGERPGWADYYWGLVVRRPASLANAAQLRLAVAGAPWLQQEIMPTDKTLLLNLVRDGHMDAAYKLAEGLGLGRSTKANLLYNGDFAISPELAPFDWQLSSQGNLGASVDPREKILAISAIGGARGSAARQLLKLAPGRYDLNWKVAADSAIDPGSLVVRIDCAERGKDGAILPPVPVAAGEGKAVAVIPDDACQWYWFSLAVVIPDDVIGLDANVLHLSLTPSTDASRNM
mgnify:CR=1 FL=1